MRARLIVLLSGTAASVLSTVPQAAATDLSFSVFGTLGYAVSDQPYHYQRFIDEHGTFTRDTLVGAQLDAKFDGGFGATVQVKAAPSTTNDNQYQVTVPWAFVSWRPSNDWLVRGGKQRIPLYLYSETVDVGVTYDFARLPTEMYSIISSNDFTGISLGKTWGIDDGDLVLEGYWGKSRNDIRFWIRDNVPPLQSSGPVFLAEDVTGGGIAVSYRRGDDTYRISVHRGIGKASDHRPIATTYPFVELAPGIGYYRVSSALPGPEIPVVDSLTETALTIGVDAGLPSAFRVIGELARTWVPGTDITLASSRGYAALLKRIDEWTPYILYAFLRSPSNARDLYLNVNYNTVPGFVPGAALINASQRSGADGLFAWDQHSWALGASYSFNANSKLKAEFQRVHIGQMSSFVDAPPGGNVRNQNISVFTINYNVVF